MFRCWRPPLCRWYCFNAKIKDNNADLDVVFFNEAMTQMPGITCQCMITKHREDDACRIPQKILETAKTLKFMSLTMMPYQTVVVNSVNANDDSQIIVAASSTKEPTSTASIAPITPTKRGYEAQRRRRMAVT